MWTKFKHWLIRKLGGHVGLCAKCNKYKQTLIKTTRPIETIRSQCWVDSVRHIDPEASMALAEQYVFDDLMRGLKDGNYIKYEYEDDRILHGTLMVVRPV